MEYLLLRDQIKNFIGQSKIVAACFFSYNFDSDFFENYLLPLFVPDAPFNDNKIQNAILWRKYAPELPNVAVVCDFNAKGSEAPSLNYDVFTRDMKKIRYHKPVFHCKQSYILTNDQRLMVINGSNNLTYSGWCKNIEGITIEEFKNGQFFPRTYKNQYRGFINYMCSQYPATRALESIKSFFNKQKYTPEPQSVYWNSGMFSFDEFLRRSISETIDEIEVLSPYIYGDQCLKHLHEYCNTIRFNIPFEATDVVGIGKEIYDLFIENGIQWSLLNQQEESKDFRFNHSKIYRFKGQDHFYTIIGSVNFTEMAWKGVKNGGNYENAVLHVEPIEQWKPFLTPHNGNVEKEFRFTENKEEQNNINHPEAPNLSFIIDWQENVLQYENKETYQCEWINEHKNKMINFGEDDIKLSISQKEELSKNPAIKIGYSGNTFIYYPKQVGMDFKPLPTNLRLNNEQIFKLWNELIKNKEIRADILYLESLLRKKLEDSGDWKEEYQHESILNYMSAHLSGLIQLEKVLFPKQTQEQLIHYYLVVDNIDTIWGYLNCLKKEVNDGRLQKSFAWLCMEIVNKQLFEKSVKLNLNPALQNSVKLKCREWKKEINQLRKEGIDLDEKLLKWTLKQL